LVAAPVTISPDQPAFSERVIRLSGTTEGSLFTLHIEAACISVPTERIEEDEGGPFAVVQEQQVPILGDVLNVECCGDDEALLEVPSQRGEDSLHLYFVCEHYDDAGHDFDSPARGHPPPPVRRGAGKV